MPPRRCRSNEVVPWKEIRKDLWHLAWLGEEAVKAEVVKEGGEKKVTSPELVWI